MISGKVTNVSQSAKHKTASFQKTERREILICLA